MEGQHWLGGQGNHKVSPLAMYMQDVSCLDRIYVYPISLLTLVLRRLGVV